MQGLMGGKAKDSTTQKAPVYQDAAEQEHRALKMGLLDRVCSLIILGKKIQLHRTKCEELSHHHWEVSKD